MKIAKVEAIPVSYPEPNDFNALRHLCLAKITADDGQVGWGESITQFPEANFAAKAIIEGMAPNLIGKDPVQTETLWRQNKQQAWWYGYHGGIASYAIAAIDIALWDLKGKALGKSVLDLLGGPVHERLPAIASCHAHYESIPEMAEETRGVALDRPAGPEDRLRQARQRPSRLRPRPRRRLRQGDARGARRQDADDRQRHRHQMGRHRRRAPRQGDGGIQPRLDRGAARRLGPGGLRQSARQDDDAHRLWRARMDARAVRARAGDRHGRRGRRRSRPRRGHHRLQEGHRALRVLSPPGQRPCLVVGDRHRGEPGDLVQLAGLQAVRVQAAAQSDAARPRHQAVRARRRLGLSADRAGPRHRGHRGGRRRLSQREGARPDSEAAAETTT